MQLDADGQKKPADALGFGDEAGDRIGRSGPRGDGRAQSARHEARVEIVRLDALTSVCLAQFKRIDL